MLSIDKKPPIETTGNKASTIAAEEPKPLQGKSLSQVFNKDTLTSSQTQSSPHASNQDKAKPLPAIPELTPPTHSVDPSFSHLSPVLSRKKVDLKSLLTPIEISEALTLMKEKTVDSILLIVFKAQLELENENAGVTEGTYSKNLSFQKLQNAVLEKIKDTLIQDENVTNRLKTGQDIALAASLISGVAAAAIEYGLLGPVGGFIGTALGATLQTTFIAAANFIGGIGPYIAGGLTATTSGAQIYYQHQTNQHNADHEIHKHKNRYLSERANDLTGHLSRVVDNQHTLKEAWFRALKRLHQMRQVVLSN